MAVVQNSVDLERLLKALSLDNGGRQGLNPTYPAVGSSVEPEKLNDLNGEDGGTSGRLDEVEAEDGAEDEADDSKLECDLENVVENVPERSDYTKKGPVRHSALSAGPRPGPYSAALAPEQAGGRKALVGLQQVEQQVHVPAAVVAVGGAPMALGQLVAADLEDFYFKDFSVRRLGQSSGPFRPGDLVVVGGGGSSGDAKGEGIPDLPDTSSMAAAAKSNLSGASFAVCGGALNLPLLALVIEGKRQLVLAPQLQLWIRLDPVRRRFMVRVPALSLPREDEAVSGGCIVPGPVSLCIFLGPGFSRIIG